MTCYLCIDVGNTRTKAALYPADPATRPLLLETFDQPLPGEDFFRSLLRYGAIAAAALCSVGAPPTELEARLRELKIPVLVVDDKTPLPIINAYRTSGTLGPDRLALAVGLYDSFPEGNALAVSAGTCITYNYLTDQRAFRGGLIAPGLQMRLDAMHRFTARLPQVPLPGETPLLGYDTETSMRSGVVLGAAAEIEGLVARYEARYPQGFNAVLTGGNAAELSGHVKCRIFADPFLLFRGLHRILRHNAVSLRLAP